jgi:hypothetical protein
MTPPMTRCRRTVRRAERALLGAQAAECSGFRPLDTAGTRTELDDLQQRVLDLQRTLEERDEQLAADREPTAGSWPR